MCDSPLFRHQQDDEKRETKGTLLRKGKRGTTNRTHGEIKKKTPKLP